MGCLNSKPKNESKNSYEENNGDYQRLDASTPARIAAEDRSMSMSQELRTPSQPMDIPRKGSSATTMNAPSSAHSQTRTKYHDTTKQSSANEQGDAPMLSSSVDRRNLELELHKRIVEQADEQFIDTAQHALDVGKEDPSHPSAQAYASLVCSTVVDAELFPIGSIPNGSSQSGTKLAQLVSAPTQSAQDMALLEKLANTVTTAMNQTVVPKAVGGSIVAHFSEA